MSIDRGFELFHLVQIIIEIINGDQHAKTAPNPGTRTRLPDGEKRNHTRALPVNFKLPAQRL
jgi:hypothetical protein